MTEYKIDFGSIAWESPMEGIRQKIYRIDNHRLRLVEYSKNMPPHWCVKGHVGCVLEGQLRLEFEHEIQTYCSGDGICIPDGREHRHSAQVLTDTVTVVFFEDV